MGYDISQITDFLYISAWPKGKHLAEIHSLDIRLILSMHWRRPDRELSQPPLQLLWLPTFDTPLIPMPLTSLSRGVQAALPVIQQGGRVLCHCSAGRHRSVAMACCVLIGRGMRAEEAMQLVKARRAEADPYTPYIRSRITKFEVEWRNHPG
jgi:protein-tyrosine phosphatase